MKVVAELEVGVFGNLDEKEGRERGDVVGFPLLCEPAETGDRRRLTYKK
jgi:hypothetical protein